MFRSLVLGIWVLSFDLAQDGESFDFAQDREPVERLVEPFVVCELELGIFYSKTQLYLDIFFDFLNLFVGNDTRQGVLTPCLFIPLTHKHFCIITPHSHSEGIFE
jgi:hypothetical protein